MTMTQKKTWRPQQMQNAVALQNPKSRFLSESECLALAQRAASMVVGGGESILNLSSMWSGNLRYAKNEIITSGDIRDNWLALGREIQGAWTHAILNQIDDIGLEAAVRRVERMVVLKAETSDRRFREHYAPVDTTRAIPSYESEVQSDPRLSDGAAQLIQTQDPHSRPKIFFDKTYNLSAQDRVEQVTPLIASARAAKLYAAGYAQVSAFGQAQTSTWGRALYYPYTKAEFSVTVRDPTGTGSGWAGVDWGDWTRINLARLTEIAMDKCLRSRNPVAIEPGRYTAILEPQATSDIFSPLMSFMDREYAELGYGPFTMGKPDSKIGQMVLDRRITVGADPMDPDLGFVPFDQNGDAIRAVNWIENGVLKDLAYSRSYGIRQLGKNVGLPNSYAYRMSGGTATVEDMIATTKRGLLVTRFSNVNVVDQSSVHCAGYTRDGLWLIEDGKISKAVKNFRFLESPMFIFNNLETLGEPVRVYRRSAATIVPSAKVRDFNFASLIEAV